MEQWTIMGHKLRDLVNPSTMPVAVKIMKEGDQVPANARRPLRDFRVKMAPCQGAAITRRYGWTVAFTHEDVGCAIAAHSYGWERITDKQRASNFFTQMNYAIHDNAANEIFDSF